MNNSVFLDSLKKITNLEVRMARNKVYMQTSMHKHVKQNCCPLNGDVRRRMCGICLSVMTVQLVGEHYAEGTHRYS